MKSVITYRILALLLGFLGAHNFYFGYKRRALIQLAISVLSLGFFIPIAWVLALYDIATVAHENMSALTKNGKTPLQNILLNEQRYAAESVEQLADVLIQGGVDVNVLSADGETALHLVARNAGQLPGGASEHIMRSLLDAGANPSVQNASKQTALQVILNNECNRPSIECERLVKALVAAKGEKKSGDTWSLSKRLGDLFMTKLQKTGGVNPLSFDASVPDSAALWILLYNKGNLSGEVVREIMRLLLQAGAAPDLLNSKGERPLQYLAKEPDHICSYIGRDIVQCLIEFGADTRIRDKGGNTPLHLAAAAGNYSVVEALLRCGASTSAENKKKQKPIDATESYAVKAVFDSMTITPKPVKA